ncbi:type II toxin-antitoxin system HipA family toxin [Frankia sp. AgB32]|uniref:type II toxin-antitoxin system HipA family toxin n=1 Tax=Frankia sp. AgB32 TaxID=631119 RepID=UPI00200BDF0A|nr:type II toxin-antitoxin system HipA family toxin [Frankia sp. AgB32]MCK9893296.1 type II toxin-antitoxin system HipA family toxin [Frankia sp. AgB32]
MANTATLAVQLQRPTGEWVDVGELHSREQKNWFEMRDSYWNTAHRPVLGQIFEEKGSTWEPNAHVALPRWFSHLLPEGMLRAAVSDAAHISSKREFELLARLGEADLPGAVRARKVSSSGLTDVPASAADAVSDSLTNDDPLLKFSLAGVQLKFSVYGQDRGLTVPARGQAGNFVLKFPDGRAGFSGVPEAELGSLELARAAGIETPEAFLVTPGDVPGLEEWAARARGSALAVRRFDRRADGVRMHMEELAQIVNIPTAQDRAKYMRANFETIAVLIDALCGAEEVGQTIDRLVLNVLVGNGDAHLKNWAVTYPDGRRPALSPVYDVVPTVLYMPADDLGLNLNGSKAFEAVTSTSFDAIGRRTNYGVSAARARAHDATQRMLANWSVLGDFLSADALVTLTRRLGTLGLVTEQR